MRIRKSKYTTGRKLTPAERTVIREALEVSRVSSTFLLWKHRPLEHFKSEREYKSWNHKYAHKEAGFRNGDSKVYVRLFRRSIYSGVIMKVLENG